MKKLKQILAAPLIVRVLFFIYIYTVGKDIYMLLKPNLMSAGNTNYILASLFGTILGLAFMLWRIRWTWKYGIALNVFSFLSITYIAFNPPANIYEIAAKLYQTKSLSPMNQEQLELALNLSKYVTVSTAFLTSAVFIFLWYKSKDYFQTSELT